MIPEAELNRLIAYYGTDGGTIPLLLAEIRRLRDGLAALRPEHFPGVVLRNAGGSWTEGGCPKANEGWTGIWGPARCNCGADTVHAQIDALLAPEETL